MKIIIAIVLSLVLLSACSRRSESSGPERRYSLSGKVVAINSQDRTATVDAGAIPGFMEAMTMQYPVRSRSELDSLHAGDRITATVHVLDDGGYYLSDIKVQKPSR